MERTAPTDDVRRLKHQTSQLKAALLRERSLSEEREKALSMARAAQIQAEQRYQDLVELTSDYIYRLGVRDDGTLEGFWTTGKFTEITGYEAPELEALGGLPRLLHPEDVAILPGRARRLFKGESDVAEFRVMTKAGQIRWLRDYARPIIDEQTGRAIAIVGAAQDITVRKEIEQQLHLERAKFQQLVENAEDIIYTIDLRGRFTYVNPITTRITGFRREELIGRHFLELVRPDYIDEVSAFYKRQVVEEIASTYHEFPVVFRDQEIWLGQSVQLVKENNRVRLLQAVARDKTERREAEEALRTQQAFLKQVIDINPALIFAKDREGRYTLANQALADVYGTTVENMIGKSDGHFNPDKAKVAQFLKDDQEVMETLEEKRIPVDVITDVQGNTRRLLTIKRPMIGADGKAHQVLGVITDVTRRVLTEEALRMSEQRLLSVVTSLPIILFAMDKTGRFTLAEGKGLSQIGLKSKELVGRSVYAAFANNQEFLAAVERGLAGESCTIRYPLGHHILETTFQPMMDNRFQVSGTIGVSIDITERVGLEERTQRMLAQRSNQVRLATEIAQDLAMLSDIRDLYRRVVEAVKERFSYYHAQLFVCDQRRERLSLAFGYGEIGAQMMEEAFEIPMGVGLIGLAAQQAESVLRASVADDEDWASDQHLPETKGELAVPIMFRGRVLGVLDVQTSAANQLQDEDQLMIESLCGQIAIAIATTEMQQQMAQNLDELKRLQRVMSREGWENYHDQLATPLSGVRFDQQNSYELPAEELLRARNRAIASQPLAVRGEPIGEIAVLDSAERPLSAEEMELLEAITVQVSESLESARLMEQTQTALAGQERVNRELETVAEVSTAASTILDVEQLLQTVVDLAKARFGFYHAHIYLLDKKRDTLLLEAGAGRIGKIMKAEKRAIPFQARSLVARAARRRTGLIANDTDSNTSFLPHPLLTNTRAELAVPMIVGDELLGVYDVQSDRPNAFTEKDLLIQTALASQVAVALQNARLYADQLATAERLREVDRLKSEFLASMSHELRTPLNSIIGFADVLLEGLDGELNERMEEDVTLIRNSGRHLRELIGNILDMSKIEAGMMTIRFAPTAIRRIVDDVVGVSSILAQEKNLTLTANVGKSVGEAFVDRTRLTQVLLNMIGNAIKFTDKGGVTINVDVVGQDLNFAIADTGIGISEADLPIVFEQFRQVDGSMTRESGGTGLGMPISMKLVELHGGAIRVESQVGEGTTFSFNIPNRQSAPEIIEVPAPLT